MAFDLVPQTDSAGHETIVEPQAPPATGFEADGSRFPNDPMKDTFVENKQVMRGRLRDNLQ